MLYLIAQIVLCLLAAFVLGAVVMWLITRGGSDRAAHEAESQSVASTSKLETELAAAREGMERYRDRARALEKDLASLRERMEGVRRELEKEKQSAGGDSNRTKELEAQLAKLREEADKSADAAKNAAARAGELDALVNSQKGKLASLQEEVEGLADLRKDLASAKNSIQEKEERITALQAERDSARAAAASGTDWKDKIESLESDVQNRAARIDSLTEELRQARADCEDRLHAKDDEIARLRTKPAEPREKPARPPKKKPAAKSGKPDDLKRIKGIGVVLEKLLHKNGVRTFEEIASWSREDVERVDAKLENFKGRIKRDDWIAQAKRLCKD